MMKTIYVIMCTTRAGAPSGRIEWKMLKHALVQKRPAEIGSGTKPPHPSLRDLRQNPPRRAGLLDWRSH